MHKARAFFLACEGICLLEVLGLSLSATEGACQTRGVTINFVSDRTWQVNAMNADGSVGPTMGSAQWVCACSSCPPGATALGHPYCWGADLSAIPGACWIWQPGVSGETSPADLQGAYFTKEFNLLCPQVSGRILVAADDFAEVLVNGSVVGTTGSVTDYGLAAAAQGALREFDLSPFLIGGQNTITIRAQNGPSSFTGGRCDPCSYAGNPAGVVFGGSVSYSAATPATGRSWGTVKQLYH